MRKICVKFVPRVLREDQKERRCHDSRKMVELTNSDPAVLDALVTCDGSWIYCYDPKTKRQSSQWKHTGSPRPKKVRQNKSTHKLLMTPSLTALACACVCLCTQYSPKWAKLTLIYPKTAKINTRKKKQIKGEKHIKRWFVNQQSMTETQTS